MTRPSRSILPSMSARSFWSGPSKSRSTVNRSAPPSSGVKSSFALAERLRPAAALACSSYKKLLPDTGSTIAISSRASSSSPISSGSENPELSSSVSSSGSDGAVPSGRITLVRAIDTRSICNRPVRRAKGDQSNTPFSSSRWKPSTSRAIRRLSICNPVQMLPSTRPSSNWLSVAAATVSLSIGVIARKTGPVPATPMITSKSTMNAPKAIALRRTHFINGRFDAAGWVGRGDNGSDLVKMPAPD